MYETQNKKVISHLAKADLKASRMRNLFIMVTIMIATALLLVMGLFPSAINREMQYNLRYSQHVIYMNVNQAQIDKLNKDDRIAYMTYDKLGESMEVGDYKIWRVYYDGDSDQIRTMKVNEGALPRKGNEVVVSKEYMEQVGKPAVVGTQIQVPSLSGEKETCTVTGFFKHGGSNIYPIVYSKDYADNGKHLKDVNYDALVKIQGADDMSQVQFEETMHGIAKKAGVERANSNPNNAYMGTLPSDNLGDMAAIGIIGLIILIAGVMVIYSVFYISVTGKIRDYGQLRTLGMTRKQIKKLIRKEGLALCVRSAPVGMLLAGIMIYLIKPHGFSLPTFLIAGVLVLAIVGIVTLLSVMKPAKIAASVSPIEATRYTAYTGGSGKKATKTVKRKLTAFNMAKMNSFRNKKKTFVTILSLGFAGVLFIGGATYMESFDKDLYSRQGEFAVGEFIISISENALATAKNGQAEIQMNNPLTDELAQSVQNIPGVKKVERWKACDIAYDYEDQKEKEDWASPFTKKEAGAIQKQVEEGNLDYDEMLRNNQIAVKNNDVAEEIFGWRFQVGDEVTLHFWNGKSHAKTYEIGAIIKPEFDELSKYNGWFMMPEEELAAQNAGINLDDRWVIVTDPAMTNQVEGSLKQVLSASPELNMSTLREHAISYEESMNQMFLLIMALAAFVTLFSLINLLNTLITNFLSQKTELAMLQSIGMTGKQLKQMVIGEGAILAIGNVIIAVIGGSLLGFGLCQFMHGLGARYMVYSFPYLYVLGYILVILLVPYIIASVEIKKFKKQSIVERLREV